MPSDFLVDSIDHKRRVGLYLQKVANALFGRAIVHDNSKFSPEEYEPYDKAFPEFKKHAFGSEGMKAVYESISPALDHHFDLNRHHPEYFKSGIDGMNLIDVIEMVCDWLAASSRSKVDIHTGLLVNKEKFGIDDQLFGIIERTVIELTGPSCAHQPNPNTLYPDVLLSGKETHEKD